MAEEAPAAAAATDEHRARLPFIARHFPKFTQRQWRVFGISTTAGFFDNYDGALLSLALKQIQRGLGIAEGSLGAMLSLIRLGYLGSLFISPLADVFGRRRLLLYTALSPLLIFLSFPACFLLGAAALAWLPDVLRARRPSVFALYGLFGVVL